MDTNLIQKLMKAKADFPPVLKDGTNPHFKNTFVTLPALLDAIEPTLTKHGLYLEQPQEIRDGMLVQVTRVIDVESGEYRESCIPIDLELAAHQVCGATTYYRRYTLLGLLGLKAEDDDGNTASEPKPVEKVNGKRTFGKKNSEFVGN